jgi:hypothetical protein
MTIQKRNSLITVFIAAAVFACTSPHKNQTSVGDIERDVAQAKKGPFDLAKDDGDGLDKRGSLFEYDPGPKPDSTWVKLFGEAPNYRTYGKTIIGATDEKFRFLFGPMFYRGRLGKDEVKVFVVGQEGAQDENISNRAFTGSTGTKTQNFLNHLGITKSYLFLNTFVYTINGQLEPDNANFAWMEQGETSPIVQYRHKLFDNMLEQNRGKVALFMGVGTGGKASLVTWINKNGGTCSTAKNLANCVGPNLDGFIKKKQLDGTKLLVIGVPHPGGANPNLGGEAALEAIKIAFNAAARRVGEFKKQNPDWLKPDVGTDKEVTDRLLDEKVGYKYSNAPVPYRDFAFGTNWRMGASGTSSNRKGANSIQVFSSEGVYAPPPISYNPQNPPDSDNFFAYRTAADSKAKSCSEVAFSDDEEVNVNMKDQKRCDGVIGMMSTNLSDALPVYDLPYEHPRYGASGSKYKAFDPGPCGFEAKCPEIQALMGWPDFKLLDPTNTGHISHATFGFGPSYRGRLGQAKVLVIADQESHDDMFSARALTGLGGQRLQAFLNAVGVGYDENANPKSGLPYAIIRTLPVDSLANVPAGQHRLMPGARDLALNPKVVEARNKIISQIVKKSGTKVIVTLGEIANEVGAAAISDLKLDVELVSLADPADNNHVQLWEQEAGKVSAILKNEVKSLTPGTYTGKVAIIPREDLPYSTRWWMGTSGSRGLRGVDKGKVGNYYRIVSPNWIKGQPSLDLTEDEFNQLSKDMVAAGLKAPAKPKK